ncbi:hypothetical protein NG99_04785 [Erwinia typographi]|uniref:Uncharacterized protein n=1 Tax=Erwinia typographi TaxID=371042 RepID=A0A0A3Z8Y9_9GAMM|nr:hypothetical protein [Erwinia typographi]KGT95335.1 hypothetical protein NG99_04785 [Erwinia typographi]
MYKITTAIILIFISLYSNSMELKLENQNSISINKDGVSRVITVDTMINGYNVNCNGSKIVIWGKPTKINEGNPQDTNVILIELSHNHKEFQKGISEGIFDVEYLKLSNYAYIGSSQGVLMNLSNGKLKGTDVDFDPANDSNFESCNKNKSWYFNRYP